MEQDHANAAGPAGGPGPEPGRDLLGPGTMVVDGRYRLASIVARSGNDTVYSALDERARNRVRLRVTAHGPDPELVRLHHPAIPAVLDRGRVGRWHYVVLEWFDGAPLVLPEVSNTSDPARLRAWATTAMDLLDALEHAHTTSGRAHGDIGVHGLWEGSDGRLRFLDFSGPEGALTADAVPYASPERLRGLPRDARSDLYSLGSVLFALAHGVPPYGTDPIDARAGHLLRQLSPPPSRDTSPFLTPPFFDILRTALEKQPHHRFASAARMRAAFHVALHELGTRSLVSQQVTVVPDPSVLDTVIPTDETTNKFADRASDGADHPSDEGVHDAFDERADAETDIAVDGTLDVPPARRFVPGIPDSEAETARRIPRKVPVSADRTHDRREVAENPPRNGAMVLAIGASVVGIVASGLAWLAAVAVLALIAAQPDSPSAGSDPLPPISLDEPVASTAVAPGTPDTEPGGDSTRVDAVDAAEPVVAEPARVEPPAPVRPATQDAPVVFPWNDYQPQVLERFPAFVALVREHQGVVRLTGHTDSRGREDVNYKMGLGRAWAVQKLLVFAGIEVVHVPIASKGELEPIADNATPEGRAANRRVTAEFFAPGEVMPEP